MTSPAADSPPEYRRRVEDRAARKRGEFVAFAACSRGPGRLLKVAVPDQRRHRVPCPVAGCVEGEHSTFMSRARRRGEVCDLGVDGADPAPTLPTAPDIDSTPSRRWRHSDDDVLAAIPTATAAAHEVAKTLGYREADPLVRRLERINRRAEEAGEVAPVIVSKSGAGTPVEVRRVGDES